jgi:anti-anti-sigma factor
MPEEAAPSPFTLDIERKDDVAVVRCHGRLVAGVGDLLYARVSQLMPDCKRIVLDLTDLTHMDSMGLGALVRLYVSAKSKGCSLELVNLGKGIRQLLGVTNLLSVFTVIGEHGGIMRF